MNVFNNSSISFAGAITNNARMQPRCTARATPMAPVDRSPSSTNPVTATSSSIASSAWSAPSSLRATGSVSPVTFSHNSPIVPTTS